jgi:hypothetical protein
MEDKVYKVSELFLFKIPEFMIHERGGFITIEPKNLDWFIERRNEKSGGKEAMEAYLLFLMGFDLFITGRNDFPMGLTEDDRLQAAGIVDI